MKRVNWMLGAALSVALAGCAVKDESAEARFARADRDRDGALTRAEFVPAAADWAFPDYDADADGAISLAEWRRIEGSTRDAAFGSLDADGDSKISKAEARSNAGSHPVFPSLWGQMDRDRDGKITLDEARAYRERRQRYMP